MRTPLTRAQMYEMGCNAVFVLVYSVLDMFPDLWRDPLLALPFVMLNWLVGMIVAYPLVRFFFRDGDCTPTRGGRAGIWPFGQRKAPPGPKTAAATGDAYRPWRWIRHYSAMALLYSALYQLIPPFHSLSESAILILTGWAVGTGMGAAFVSLFGRRL